MLILLPDQRSYICRQRCVGELACCKLTSYGDAPDLCEDVQVLSTLSSTWQMQRTYQSQEKQTHLWSAIGRCGVPSNEVLHFCHPGRVHNFIHGRRTAKITDNPRTIQRLEDILRFKVPAESQHVGCLGLGVLIFHFCAQQHCDAERVPEELGERN